MSHSPPIVEFRLEQAQLRPIQQRNEESSPLINAITAIAISIISTVFCYMTLPAQGATPIVAVVWILAYYLSFGSDCLDENPAPRLAPVRGRTRHDTPSQRGKPFVSPQKNLPAYKRPSSRDSIPLQFPPGAERSPAYRVHRRGVKARQEQRGGDTKPVDGYSTHVGIQSPVVSAMSFAGKAFQKLKNQFTEPDSD